MLYSTGWFNYNTTAIVFAVNQLSPSSIGIFPLTTTYPKLLPQLQVRSINLVVAGSLGFGSNALDFICFHAAFRLTQNIKLLTPYAKGNWSPKLWLSTVRLSVSGSVSLPLGFFLQLSLSVLYTIAIKLNSALAFALLHLMYRYLNYFIFYSIWPLSFRSSLLREFSFDFNLLPTT